MEIPAPETLDPPSTAAPGAAPDERSNQYRTLLELAKTIAACRTLPDLFRELARDIRSLLHFDHLVIALHEEGTGALRIHTLETSLDTTLQVGAALQAERSPAVNAWRTQRVVVFETADPPEAFAGSASNLHSWGVRSFCSVPLTTPYRRLGALSMGSTTPGAYAGADLEFLQLLAAQVAIAVDNAWREQDAHEMQRQLTQDRNRLQLLLDLNNRVVSNLDLRTLFQSVSHVVRRFTACEHASLSLPEPDGVHMQIYALDFPEGRGFLQEELIYSIAGSGSGTAYRTMKPFALHRPFDGWSQYPIVQRAIQEGLQSLCFLPLVSRDRAIGTLNLGRRTAEAFTDDDLQFLAQAAAQVAIAVENALEHREVRQAGERLAEERQYLREELRFQHNFDDIVGESPALARLLQQVETVAPTDSTVLILGETGTGKELIARALHDLSGRRDQAFVKVNCAAIPSGLIESELFGHEKGAFTGALARRTGRFELAHMGTLFLDEIGDIPLELQSKLLRVLQEREFERLGSSSTTRVNVRLIAATSHDLDTMVAEKSFRSDLFYRLSVFPMSVPPLRERRDDVPRLVEHFVEKYARLMDRRIESIPKKTLDALTNYDWPGNVRELQNFIERAVILSPGAVLQAPLAELTRPSRPRVGGASRRSGTLEEVERAHIRHVLEETDWVIGGPRGAATRLGMKRTSLVYRMDKLGIRRPGP